MKKVWIAAAVLLVTVLAVLNIKYKKIGVFTESGTVISNSEISAGLKGASPDGEQRYQTGARVEKGSFLYTLLGQYYIGEEVKQQIDTSYPLFLEDGESVLLFWSDGLLYTRDLVQESTMNGMILSGSRAYNQLHEVVDEEYYALLKMSNGLYLSLAQMTVQDQGNSYQIKANSPLSMSEKALRYYEYGGDAFRYGEITDLSGEATVTILGKTYNYVEFLKYMGALKENTKRPQQEDIMPEPVEEEPIPETNNETAENSEAAEPTDTETAETTVESGKKTEGNRKEESSGTQKGDRPDRENQKKPDKVEELTPENSKKPDRVIDPDDFIERPDRFPEDNDGDGEEGGGDPLDPVPPEYQVPQVSCQDFEGQFYSATSVVQVTDPASRIIGGVTFTLETKDGFRARRTYYRSSEVILNSIRPETNYEVTGSFYYRDESGKLQLVEFYKGKVSTKKVEDLPAFTLSYRVNRNDPKPNRVELYDFTFAKGTDGKMIGWETIAGIGTMEWVLNRGTYVMNYSLVNALMDGKTLETLASESTLEANVKYDFYFRCYDMYGYELPLTWPVKTDKDTMFTSKQVPMARLVKETMATGQGTFLWSIYANPDHVEIRNLRFELEGITYPADRRTISLHDDTLQSGTLELNNLLSNANYRLHLKAECDLGTALGVQTVSLGTLDFTTVSLLNLGSYQMTGSSTVDVYEATIKGKVNTDKTNADLLRYLDSIEVAVLKPNSQAPIDNGEFIISKETLGEENFAQFLAGEYEWSWRIEGLNSGTEYNVRYTTVVKEGSGDSAVTHRGAIGITGMPNTIKTLKKPVTAEVNEIFTSANLLVFSAYVEDEDDAIEEETVLLQVQKAAAGIGGEFVPGESIYTERIRKGELVQKEVSEYLEPNSMYFITLTAEHFDRGDKAYTSYRLASLKVETELAVEGRIVMQSLQETGDPSRYTANFKVLMTDHRGTETGQFFIALYQDGRRVGTDYDSGVYSYVNLKYTQDVTLMTDKGDHEYVAELYMNLRDNRGSTFRVTLSKYAFDTTDVITEIRDEESLYKALGTDGRYVVTTDINMATENPIDESAEYTLLTNKNLSAYGDMQVKTDEQGERYFYFKGTSDTYLKLDTIPESRDLNWEDGFRVEMKVKWESFLYRGGIFDLGQPNGNYKYWNSLAAGCWDYGSGSRANLFLQSYMNGYRNYPTWNSNTSYIPAAMRIALDEKVTIRYEVVRTEGDSYVVYCFYKFEDKAGQTDHWYYLGNPSAPATLSAVIANVERSMNYIGFGYDGNTVRPFKGGVYSLQIWTADSSAQTECGRTIDEYSWNRKTSSTSQHFYESAESVSATESSTEVQERLNTGWTQIIRLDFSDYEKNNYYATRVANCFQGTIDFQGYELTNTGSLRPVLSQLGKNGTIRNLVYKTAITQDQVTNLASVFMGQNHGTLDNVYVTYEGTTKYNHTNVGAISGTNTGTISNFVVIVEGDIYTGNYAGMVAVNNYGTIKNGYVSVKDSRYAIRTMKKSSEAVPTLVGGIAGRNGVKSPNTGKIENVYANLNIVMNTAPTSVGLIIGETGGTASGAYSFGNLTYGSGSFNNNYGPAVGSVPGGTPAYNNYALSRLNYVSDNKHTGTWATRFNTRATLANMYDTEWQKQQLGSGFTVDSLVAMYRFPHVRQDVCMPAQPLISMPVVTSNITLTSAEILEGTQTRDSARLRIRAYMKAGEYTVATLTFQNKYLTAEVIPDSQTECDDDGFCTFDVDVKVTTASNNVGMYANSYKITELSYYLSDYTQKTKSIAADLTVDVQFWKEIWGISGDNNGDGVPDGWKDTIKRSNTTSEGQNYILMADLDCRTAAASDMVVTRSLLGNLDGNGHTIRNLNLDGQSYLLAGQGLNSVIQDLNFSNVSMDSPSNSQVSLFGTVNGTITNISVDGMTMRGYSEMGSIAIRMAGHSSIINVAVRDLTMTYYDNVASASYAKIGGLVAHMQDSDGQNLTLSNCFVRGLNLEVSDVVGSNGVGGLVGYIYQNRSTSRADYFAIQNCYVEGDMQVRANYVGGILGRTDDQSGYLRLKNTYARVNMIVEGKYVGGLAGYLGFNYLDDDAVDSMVLGSLNFLSGSEHYLFFGRNVGTVARRPTGVYIADSVKYIGQSLEDVDVRSKWDTNTTILKKQEMLKQATWQNILGSAYEVEMRIENGSITGVYMPQLKNTEGTEILPLQEEKLSAYEEPEITLVDVRNPGNDNFIAALEFPSGYRIEELDFYYMKSNRQVINYPDGSTTSATVQFTRNDDESDYADTYYISGVWYYAAGSQERRYQTLFAEVPFISGRSMKIRNAEDWCRMSEYAGTYTNYIIEPDAADNVLDLSGVPESQLPKNVKVNRMVGTIKDGKVPVIKGLKATYTANGDCPISRLSGEMKDLKFEGIELTGSNTTVPLGIIGTNRGDLTNVSFENIRIKSTKPNCQYVGCIGRMIGNLTVQDISLKNIEINKDVDINNSAAYAGGFAGAWDSVDTKTDNRNFSIENVYVNGDDHVGGLFGYLNNYQSTLQNVTADNVTVTGRYYVGGVFGRSYYGTISEVHATRVRATGKVVTGSSDIQYVGGITGYGNATGGVGFSLDNSGLRNPGDNEPYDITGGSQYTGGLFGLLDGSGIGTRDMTAKNIRIAGKNYTGGICGTFNSRSLGTNDTGASQLKRDFLVENCYISGASIVGGLAGRLYYGTMNFQAGNANAWVATDYMVKNCTIIGTGNQIGGGFGTSLGTVNNLSVVDSTVLAVGEDSTSCGGVVGYLQSHLYYSGIENTQVTSNAVYTGGLVGQSNTGGYNVQRCYVNNHASGIDEEYQGCTVQGRQYVGGICGDMQRNTKVAYFIVNTDVISENDDPDLASVAGGVAGYYRDADYVSKYNSQGEPIYTYSGVAIYEGYVAGSVTADEYAGGIIGKTEAEENTEKQIDNLYVYNTKPNAVVVALQSVEAVSAGGSVGYSASNRTDYYGATVTRNLSYGTLNAVRRGLRIYDGTVLMKGEEDVTNTCQSYTMFWRTNNVQEDKSGNLLHMNNTAEGTTLQQYNSYLPLLVSQEQLHELKLYTGSTNDGFWTRNVFRYRYADEAKTTLDDYMPHLSFYSKIDADNTAPASPQGDVYFPLEGSAYGIQMLSLRGEVTLTENPAEGIAVYATGPAQVNIEFMDPESIEDEFFTVFVNGVEVVSSLLEEQVYTITYNFRDTLHVVIGDKTLTVNMLEAQRKVMLWGGHSYYIGEDGVYDAADDSRVLEGEFLNLYSGKALSSSGYVYDVESGRKSGEPVDTGVIKEVAQPLYVCTVDGARIANFATFSLATAEGETEERDMLQFAQSDFAGEHVFTLLNRSNRVTADSIVMETRGDTEYRTILENGTIKDVGNVDSPMFTENEDLVTTGVHYMTTNLNGDGENDLILLQYQDGSMAGYHYLTGEKILDIEAEERELGFAEFFTFSLRNLFFAPQEEARGSEVVAQSAKNIALAEAYRNDTALQEFVASVTAGEAEGAQADGSYYPGGTAADETALAGVSGGTITDEREGTIGTGIRDPKEEEELTEEQAEEREEGKPEDVQKKEPKDESQKSDGTSESEAPAKTDHPETDKQEKEAGTEGEKPEKAEEASAATPETGKRPGTSAKDTMLVSAYNAETGSSELYTSTSMLEDVADKKSLNEVIEEQGILMSFNADQNRQEGEKDASGILVYILVALAVTTGTVTFVLYGRRRRGGK